MKMSLLFAYSILHNVDKFISGAAATAATILAVIRLQLLLLFEVDDH